MMYWTILTVVTLGLIYALVLGVGLIVWLVWLTATGQLVSPYQNQHLVLMHYIKQMENK